MRALLCLAVLALLVACGLANTTQINQTDRYTVAMSLDGQTVGTRIISITVTDKNGSPATVDSIIAAPVMHEMGMVSPEMTATALGNGRYEIKGEPFTMLGVWEVALRISAGGQEDTTSFQVEIK